MLLRLVEHPRIITLLTLVLESYHGNMQEWIDTSTKIFAAFLPPAGRLQVVLDTPSSLSSLHQLLATMSPAAINLKGMFFALLKPSYLSSLQQLGRWLALLASTLKLMVAVFPEVTVLTVLKGMSLLPPSLYLVGTDIQPLHWPDEEGVDEATKMACFVFSAVHLGTVALSHAMRGGGGGRGGGEEESGRMLLPLVMADLLLLLQTLSSGECCVSVREHSAIDHVTMYRWILCPQSSNVLSAAPS